MRRSALVLPFVAPLALAACQAPQVRGPQPLANIVRAERYTPERTAWLTANCRLARTGVASDPFIRLSAEYANYVQVIAEGESVFKNERMWQTFEWACPDEPPWPPENPRPLVENMQKVKAAMGFACRHAPLRKSTSEVLDPGTGASPAPDSFVRFRMRALEVKVLFSTPKSERFFHGRRISDAFLVTPLEKENFAQGQPVEKNAIVAAGDRGSLVEVDHVTCLDNRWGGGISKLKVGGKARLQNDLGSWQIEVLQVGGEELVRKHYGL